VQIRRLFLLTASMHSPLPSAPLGNPDTFCNPPPSTVMSMGYTRALEVYLYTKMRYINRRFTYLLTFHGSTVQCKPYMSLSLVVLQTCWNLVNDFIPFSYSPQNNPIFCNMCATGQLTSIIIQIGVSKTWSLEVYKNSQKSRCQYSFSFAKWVGLCCNSAYVTIALVFIIRFLLYFSNWYKLCVKDATCRTNRARHVALRCRTYGNAIVPIDNNVK